MVKIQLKVSSSLRRVEDVAFCTIVKNTQSKSQAKSYSACVLGGGDAGGLEVGHSNPMLVRHEADASGDTI